MSNGTLESLANNIRLCRAVGPEDTVQYVGIKLPMDPEPNELTRLRMMETEVEKMGGIARIKETRMALRRYVRWAYDNGRWPPWISQNHAQDLAYASTPAAAQAILNRPGYVD